MHEGDFLKQWIKKNRSSPPKLAEQLGMAFLFGHSDKSMSRKHYHRDKLGAYGDEIKNNEPIL